MTKITVSRHIKIEQNIERRINIGRDNKQGKSKNKDTLPQTPKNQKINPNNVQEEFAAEFAELRENHSKKKRK
ncbi:YfhD family protein [Psychrobacillus sp. NEAU-3TGS]|uniref:YfhD family protein n=1 Tax=Psychrobacillus sp. NEAU-3TGS TaxID=2995412 RepID=UPI002497B78F|nr:YfhD family protein [Psychrobacillus sp. NEAU-3TGS]MDI2586852.1 YfhD family protein [Psychrobacillus sp. NEAU-3TGS]